MNHEFKPVVEAEEIRTIDQVRTGMSVYDSTGQHIGEVSYVYLGTSTQEDLERGTGPARDVALENDDDNSFVEMLANAFTTDQIPEEMLARLRQHGYMRIDSNGIFASDRFATAEQLSSVSESEVHLNVAYDQLGTPN